MCDSFRFSVDSNILMTVSRRMSFALKYGWNGILSVLCLSLLGCSIPFGVGIVSELLLLLQLRLVLNSVTCDGSQDSKLPPYASHVALPT